MANQDLTVSTPVIVEEELNHLSKTYLTLEQNPPKYEDIQAAILDVQQQLKDLHELSLSAKEEDMPALSQNAEHLNRIMDRLEKQEETEQINPDNPYFAHLQLYEGGRTRDVFLGRATYLQDGLRIVDWRNAPVSRLFYLYQEGDEYIEDFGGSTHEGEVESRRILHIQNRQLLRVADSEDTFVCHHGVWDRYEQESVQLAGGEGAALRAGSPLSSQLGGGVNIRSNKHLPDIAALLDPEQFELISKETSGVVVIRGSAGSGKTTVALHRIAYLSFADKKKFLPRKCMFMVWGKAMRDYVAHVLPALGVVGVQVETWSVWSRECVRTLFRSKLPKDLSDHTPSSVSRLKIHPKLNGILEEYVRSNPDGDRTIMGIIEDWAQILSNIQKLKAVFGNDFNTGEWEDIETWLIRQTREISAFAAGEDIEDADSDEVRLDIEDDAILLRLHQLRIGPIRSKKGIAEFAHIAIDEVQDFSPIEITVLLNTTDENQCVTLAGDTRQHISKDAGFDSWSGFLDVIGVENRALNTLEVSYRSTHQITSFALSLLQNDEQTIPRTIRKGPPVELFRFSEHGACVAFLADALRGLIASEGLANVALLTPAPAISQMYYKGLRDAGLTRTRLITNQNFSFKPGIDIVEVSEVKGLEFDYVVVIEASRRYYPDMAHYQRLLHVAATRAVHQLWLTCVDSPSPILPSEIV
ncbi:MAG: 3'-5' exonuclease [Myxococcota bacterium]